MDANVEVPQQDEDTQAQDDAGEQAAATTAEPATTPAAGSPWSSLKRLLHL